VYPSVFCIRSVIGHGIAIFPYTLGDVYFSCNDYEKAKKDSVLNYAFSGCIWCLISPGI
jgi:hypothetical protein